MNVSHTVVLAIAGAASAQATPQRPAAQQPRPVEVLVPVHTAAADPLGGSYGTWAAGPDYKVSFDREVSFVPVLGAAAPRNLPLTWRTLSIRHGDVELADPAPATWHAGGYRFELRHGPVTEAYDVRRDGLEQTFVVDAPVGSGDLVVVGMVDTELGAAERPPTHGPIEFTQSGEPTVSYGAAVAIDAGGRRWPMTTAFDGGRIELRVPAEWLAGARWPVTVDPLLTTRRVQLGSGSVREVDVARDDIANQLFTVVSRASSSSDDDAFGFLTDDGFSTPRLAWSDVTTAWSSKKPAVAFVGGPRRWIIAFERRFASSAAVRAHLHDSGDRNLSTSFVAVNAPAGSRAARPDVGGTTGTGTGDHALIAYRTDVGDVNTNHSEIWTVRFDARNGTATVPLLVEPLPVGSRFDRASVDVSQVGDDGWLVVYEERDRDDPTPDPNIKIARFRPDGTRAGHGFVVSSSISEVNPRVAGRNGRYLVTFAAVDGSTNFPWTHGPQIAGRRIDWPLTASLPNFGPIRTLVGVPFGLTTYVNEGLSYDDSTGSYWQAVTLKLTPGVYNYELETRRIGYDVRVAERVRLSTDGLHGAVTYNDDAREFAVAYSDRASLPAVWGSRIGPPQESIASYGSGCGTAILRTRHPALLGSEFFTLQLRAAMANQPAVALVGLTGTSQPLDGIGMTNCRLLVSTILLQLPAVTGNVGQADVRFPIPTIFGLRNLRFQFAHLAPGANPLGVQATGGLHLTTW